MFAIRFLLLFSIFQSFLVGVSCGQAATAQESDFLGVSYFQGSPQDEEPRTDGIDYRQEYEKLELRLRELEDDFSDYAQADRKQAETARESADGFAESLKGLDNRLGGLTQTTDEIASTLPRLVFNTRNGPPIELFGRIHLGYYAYPDVDQSVLPAVGGQPLQDVFGLRRLRLGVQGDITDNMFYRFESEFAVLDNFDLVDDFRFRDAFIGFSNQPLFGQIFVGNQRRPYNLDQLNDSNENVFLDRSFIGNAFNNLNRRFGVSAANYTQNLRWNWRYGVFNMQDIQQTGFYQGNDYQLELASRLAGTPWYDECSGGRGYWHVAASGAIRYPDGLNPNNASQYSSIPELVGPNFLDTGIIAGAEQETLFGLETVLNFGPLQIGGEYMEAVVDRFSGFGSDLNYHGGYVYAAYMLTGEHMPWLRRWGTLGRVQPFENFFTIRDCEGQVQRGLGAWQIAARYSYLDLNDEEIVGGRGEALTLGLNWFWNRNARMQFNYVDGQLSREPLAVGSYDLFGVNFQVFF